MMTTIMTMLLIATADADQPDPPEACYDSVLIDATGIGDEPTCWFVDGDATYTSPEVTEDDLLVLELPSGGVIAKCAAWVDNDHGHAVSWDSSDSCADDPDVSCEIGLADGSTVSTFDWRITVSASGRATLTCFYEP